MLRLPRAAHYSICDSLCAHDTARLSETASQWYRKDDPRHAAIHACVADRVARARGIAARHPSPTSGWDMENVVVPGKSMASMLKFLEAVEWPEVHGNGKIVEQRMMISESWIPISVEGHEDIDGQVVARASSDRGPFARRTRRASGIVAVAGQHVTRIKPHQPYYIVSYGTVVHEEEVTGGETSYDVLWADEPIVQRCTMGEGPFPLYDGIRVTGRRIVTKRPSWEPKPAFSPSTWKEMEERAKELAFLRALDRLHYG